MILKNSFLFSYAFAVIASVFFSSSLLGKETYTIESAEKLNFKYFVSGIPISGEFYIDKTSFTIDFSKEEQSRFYIKIDLKKKLLYLSGTSNILIDGKNISGEDIIFDYKNYSILNSENLRIKIGNS